MPPLDQSLGFVLKDVARLMRRNFARRAQDLGLSMAQWQALANLARQEGVNQATLAEALEVQPISLARSLDRLQELGLVERRPDPADRRAFRLYLTAEAQPLIERMWTLAAETRAEALAGFSEAQQRTLIEMLSVVKQNLLDAEQRPAKEAAAQARTAARNA